MGESEPVDLWSVLITSSGFHWSLFLRTTDRSVFFFNELELRCIVWINASGWRCTLDAAVAAVGPIEC